MNTKSFYDTIRPENRFYVYGHIRTDIMEVFYVGLGSGNRKESKHHRNDHWWNVFNKCNGNLRLVTFAENITFEEACSLEIELIKQYGRKDKGLGLLVNKTDGGEGTKNIVVTREKADRCAKAISKALKEKYSKEPHHSIGRKPSKEEIDYKQSCIKKKTEALGRKKTINVGLNHKQCLGNVYQYDKNNNLIAVYESTGLAEKATGIHSGRISSVINGKRSHSKGFIFKRL